MEQWLFVYSITGGNMMRSAAYNILYIIGLLIGYALYYFERPGDVIHVLLLMIFIVNYQKLGG